MAKVAQVMRFYSLDEILDFMKQGGEYPGHNLWGFDKIKESQNTIEYIDFNTNSKWNRIGKKIRILNLQQQINILKKSKQFDVIYGPFIQDIFILAFLKVLGVYNKPIIGLGLDVYIPNKDNFLKKMRQKILRYIYDHGIDSLLFINENTYLESNKYSELKKSHDFSRTWGADVDFFDSFIDKQIEPPAQDYIYSTGGTGRDFKTLIEAFKEIDFTLRITTKRDEIHSNNITPNILINNSIKPGLHSVGEMRKEYYNALAVAIPLNGEIQNAPIGHTVIWEAFAMGKPVLSTYNKLHQFDIEKEKVGFSIGDKDVEGWRQCINYLVNNPEEAKEMGERGKYLCKKRYNYNSFSNEIIELIDKIKLSH